MILIIFVVPNVIVGILNGIFIKGRYKRLYWLLGVGLQLIGYMLFCPYSSGFDSIFIAIAFALIFQFIPFESSSGISKAIVKRKNDRKQDKPSE